MVVLYEGFYCTSKSFLRNKSNDYFENDPSPSNDVDINLEKSLRKIENNMGGRFSP
jgi:hypothetical protein